MNGSFSARSVRLGDLLSGNAVYAMPGFQRPYCWTTVELGRLLDDILFACGEVDDTTSRQGAFFLGTLVLIKTHETTTGVGGSEVREHFDIVDGQQRLISLTMLIAALRDLSRADGDTPLAEQLDRLIAFNLYGGAAPRDYRLVVRERDEAVLVNYAQQMDGCLADVDPDEHEGAQRDIILNRNYLFEELKALDPAMRPRLAHFLEVTCQAVVISTDDTDNAFRIFSVVNQQGKPLARNDLLKAELIGAVPAGMRAAYVRRWEAAEQGCGTQFEQLFSHIRAAYGNNRGTIINEIRRLVREDGGGQAFLDRRMLPLAGVHAAILGRVVDQPILAAPALRSVRILERLSHADWMPSALLWISERQQAPDEVTAFLKALDRFAYGQMLLGLGRDKRTARYGAIIEAIRSGQSPHTERGLMSFSAEEQRNILYNATHNLYGRSSIACKLLLLRINDVLEATALEVPGYVDPANISVEHVLPQRVSANSPWRHAFTDAERTLYASSLGNLVLASSKTNTAAKNYAFDRKLVLYKEDAEMGQLLINRDVIQSIDFSPAIVQARETRLIDSLRTLWDLPPPPPASKKT
jgi:hypothetical protein